MRWLIKHHALYPILFGLTSLFASFVLLLAILWAMRLRGWRLVGAKPEEYLALDLAFAQVYGGFVAVFLAGALGWYAVQEFASGQEKPDLQAWYEAVQYVPFADENGETVGIARGHDYRSQQEPLIRWRDLDLYFPPGKVTLDLGIFNAGERPASSYRVRILAIGNALTAARPGFEWDLRVKREEYWESRTSGITAEWTFFPKGDFAVYPGNHLRLMTIGLVIRDSFRDSQLRVSCTVNTIEAPEWHMALNIKWDGNSPVVVASPPLETEPPDR